TRNEEAGRTSAGVRLRAVQSIADRLCRIALLTQKQVCPRVDEEVDALLVGRVANSSDAVRLPVDSIEADTLHNAVFEVHPDNPQVEHTGYVCSQYCIVVAVSSFKVHGHRDIDRARDARNDLLDQSNRDGFTVPVALRLCNGPAAGRDSLCAHIQNGLSGTSIPGIVQQEWSAFDVERREACSFFILIHFVLLSARWRAVKGVTPSNVAWSGPSAVNSSSA